MASSSISFALSLFLFFLLGGGVCGSAAHAGPPASPVVRGLDKGLRGISQLIDLHLARTDQQILMSPGGRLTLFPHKDGSFLVSERTGDRVRNFSFVSDGKGNLEVKELEIMVGGSILNPGTKLLRGEALQKYLDRLSK
jgi:hypothetical protein